MKTLANHTIRFFLPCPKKHDPSLLLLQDVRVLNCQHEKKREYYFFDFIWNRVH